ncbi:MAG: dihydropteroate synthase, partial [Longimicrobiales bacterium]
GGGRGLRGSRARRRTLMSVTPPVGASPRQGEVRRGGAWPEWITACGSLHVDRPLIAGILNVTPDSFWDGGRHAAVDAAVARAERLLEEGADLIDVGGESTRPGAVRVAPEVEAGRVLPIARELARRWPNVPVSIDTVKASVALEALDAGAAIVNDVSGLRIDAKLGNIVARAGAGIVLMHSRGAVERMASYDLAEYGDDAVGEIVAELRAALGRAGDAGIAENAVVLDPGLGFSKRTEHSVAVIAGLERVVALGRPVMVGPSRKRFIGETAGGLPAHERLEGTIAACVAALLNGARLFRVHDVLATRRALDLAEAIRSASPRDPVGEGVGSGGVGSPPATRNPHPGTGHREPATGNRQPATGNRIP